MSVYKKIPPDTPPPPGLPRFFSPLRLVTAHAIAALLACAPSVQAIECLPKGQYLVKIPELAAKDGKLRATILLSDQQQRLTFREPPSNKPGDPSNVTVCNPQYVRVLKGVDAQPSLPKPKPDSYPDPVPGPTLRARVGDLVELSFVNQINPNDFGASIDNGETKQACDSSNAGGVGGGGGKGYPGADTFPDCFHGSSTANIHFHGTHVNPNSTGDNVFIQVRPSLRKNGKPEVTPESVRRVFSEFYKKCEANSPSPNVAQQWPNTWDDLPPIWRTEQERLLKAYDTASGQKLWEADEAELKQGIWPEYYIGAFPYCFRIPQYTAQPQAGSKPSVIMGQSPGTHWYHAHKHGSTFINVSNGMTGAFIIEGQYDDDLDTFYGKGWTRKQPVILINQLGVSPNLMRGGKGRTDKGPDFSVNGRQSPTLTMRPGEVQLWRILNTSPRAGAFFPKPPVGFQWKQLAQDGVQFNDANYQASANTSFLMASGNRVDLLVKAPSAPNTYPLVVQNEVDPSDLATAFFIPLLTVKVAGEPVKMDFIPQAPSFPSFLSDITSKEVQNTRTIRYASSSIGSGAVHTIDGKKFNGEVGVSVDLSKVEEWKVLNETYGPPISHPFHIHINPFQVVEVFSPNDTVSLKGGGSASQYIYREQDRVSPDQCLLDPSKPDTWKPCTPASEQNMVWWDVFPIPSGATPTYSNGDPVKGSDGKQLNVPGYFKMRSRFVDYTGLYVTHCHILAHEDRGMMTVVEVKPVGNQPLTKIPYSHH